MKINHGKCVSRLILLLLAAAGPTARADLAFETETARLLDPGEVQLSTAFEFQTSSKGKEYALPMAVEFGLFNRLEMLIEPVPFTSIKPSGGGSTTGVGDTEATLTYLFFDEKKVLPAFAFAGEIKFPTAQNNQIGSREFDYRLYFIATKRLGDFDLSFNLGYTFVESPPGARTKNPIDLAFVAEWSLNPKFDLFAEITYTQSSLGSSNSSEGTPAGSEAGATAEIGAEETVGTVGARYHINRHWDVFGSFSYDNNDAKLFRTGFSWKF